MARVAKGWGLLDRRQFASAAAAVAGVATNYVYNAEATLPLPSQIIEAEAAFQADKNDTSPTGNGWLGILNNLRATAITPAMAPLADPGSIDARVDLIFRERAFWMYGTGHRMADLRRILRQYGRTEAQTWPKGVYKAGVSYGNEVVFILTLSEQANPNVRVCTDKNP